jgi:hypothetical protein
MSIFISRFLCLGLQLQLAMAPIAVTPTDAQTGAASGLSGRVTDPTGASMAGVTVTITRPEAGLERITTTNLAGDWEARFLPPGIYRITFEQRGFKTLQHAGIVVTTGQMAAVDAMLELGDLTEAIAVSADARMVSANSAAIVRTLDRKELEALPTSARNITQLLAIEPGVSADISELLSNDNASISPSVNGARTTNNAFVFNGIDVTNMLCCNSRINGSRGTIDAGGGTLSRNIAPAPETLEEVKLQTSLCTTPPRAATAAGSSRWSRRPARTAFPAPPTITSRTMRCLPTTSSSTGLVPKSPASNETKGASPSADPS